jgi:predicted amidophosphoribosyltransferase
MKKDNESEEDKIYGVSEVDGKYICAECHSEIPEDQDYCPGCKRNINWEKVYIELHRTFP